MKPVRKRLNTQDFIERANITHNNKYDYSKSVYTKGNSKICIICPKHGEFYQIAISHMKDQGCPKCGKEASAKSRRWTTPTFVKKANQVHHNYYDYSEAVYVGADTKLNIRCPKHGIFSQTPSHHLRGVKCPQCALRASRGNVDTFIQKANQVHHNYYDYSKVVYTGCMDKVIIICPKHGEFLQSPNHHISGGKGCWACGRNRAANTAKHDTKGYIQRAKAKHGDLYDYSKVIYTGVENKVKIICKIHGGFEQVAGTHINGHGCRKCSNTTVSTLLRSNSEEFIAKAKLVHGDRYDYSKVDYVNNATKVTIVCGEHGEFSQIPRGHLAGKGCPACGGNVRLTTQDFVDRANITHNNYYDYSKTNYVSSRVKVNIICPKHGMFTQSPKLHLNKQKCPKCAAGTGEQKMIQVLDQLGLPYKYQYTIPNSDTLYRYDFAFPSIKLLIEYDETQHRSRSDIKERDLLKNKLANDMLYTLVRIPETKNEELAAYLPYVISKYGKYYVNGNFYMTVSELCKYENIKHTGDIKDYEQYLVYKK